MEKNNEEKNAIVINPKEERKEKIKASFAKVVKANGKALERLSKN
ncbi:hypothetical protein [Oceanobacillus zhaokaii]|nr:hypothetical protein [Oceanobacillus zhaokaii]